MNIYLWGGYKWEEQITTESLSAALWLEMYVNSTQTTAVDAT